MPTTPADKAFQRIAADLELFDGAAGEWAGQLGFQSVKDLEPGHDV